MLDSVSVSGIVSSIISSIIVSLTGQLKMFEDIVSASPYETALCRTLLGETFHLGGLMVPSSWDEEKEGLGAGGFAAFWREVILSG